MFRLLIQWFFDIFGNPKTNVTMLSGLRIPLAARGTILIGSEYHAPPRMVWDLHNLTSCLPLLSLEVASPQSWTHSHTLPDVSYTPQGLGENEPTGNEPLVPPIKQPSQLALLTPTLSPHQYLELVPARAAYPIRLRWVDDIDFQSALITTLHTPLPHPS